MIHEYAFCIGCHHIEKAPKGVAWPIACHRCGMDAAGLDWWAENERDTFDRIVERICCYHRDSMHLRNGETSFSVPSVLLNKPEGV